MLTADEIKMFARSNGIHAIGWFAAADFDGYLATIRARADYHAMAYRPLSAFLKAGHVPEGIRTVIVLVMDYFVEAGDRARAICSRTTRAPAGIRSAPKPRR